MERLSLTRIAYAVAAVLPVLYLIAFTGLAWLGFGPEPYFVIPIALIGIASLWWPNRWMMAVGALIAVVAVIGSSQGNPGYLRPDRQLEFSYWWLSVASALTLVVTSILHFVAARRATGTRTSWAPVGIVALALGLYLGGVATSAQEHSFVPAAEGAAIGLHADAELNLTAQGDRWSPATLPVPLGKIVKLTITNKDAGSHVFNEDSTGLRVDLPAGATKTVWLRLDTAGTTQWYCELHAEGASGQRTGMVGAFNVA